MSDILNKIIAVKRQEVAEAISQWPHFAAEGGVNKEEIGRISEQIRQISQAFA